MRYLIVVLLGVTTLGLAAALAFAAWLFRKPINWEIRADA